MKVECVVVYNGGGDSWRELFRSSVVAYCKRHGLRLIEDRRPGYEGYEHVKGFWLRKMEVLAEQQQPFLYIDADVWAAPWAPPPPHAVGGFVRATPKKQPWSPSGRARPVSSGVLVAPGGEVFASAHRAMKRAYDRSEGHLHGDQHFINRHCVIERIDVRWNAIVPDEPSAPSAPSVPLPTDAYLYHPLAPTRAKNRGEVKEQRIRNTEAYRRAQEMMA